MDYCHAIAQSLYLLHYVGGEQHRGITPHGADDLADLSYLIGVETIGWLIEYEHFGTVNEGSSQSHPLAIPLGKHRNLTGCHVG